ncbi:MAG: cytochrome c oxidase, subunit [Devosia sp.]|nr:cytochrome c oxidase, subunit [Devosia sp.]
MRALRAAIIAVVPLLLAGCDRHQSVILPAGPEAVTLANLFWSFLAVLMLIWVLVLLVLAVGLMRSRPIGDDPLALQPVAEQRYGRIVSALALATGVIVVGLSLVSYDAQARLFSPGDAGLTLKIVGHQWWWEIQYEDADPSRTFTTANELHLPVGVPITLKLTSSDVIHSFWVPSLMGKMDAITGRENQVQFTIEEPGTYRGQCAEFCGAQHAHMAIVVRAETPEDFSDWRTAQTAPAASPDTDGEKAGLEVFLSNPCVSCHAIRGTPAGGRTGPDLTHLASRSMLGAGTLPLTRGALAAWITDPQGTKPGVHMPLVMLRPADLHPLLDYLESLE